MTPEEINQKANKYAQLKHKEEYYDSAFARDIAETEIDFARGYTAALAEVAEMPTDLSEPIQDALYATGRFTTDECETLCEGILLYINEFRNRMKEPKSKAIEMPTEEDRQFCEEIKVIAISNYAADIPRLIIRLFRTRMSKPNTGGEG